VISKKSKNSSNADHYVIKLANDYFQEWVTIVRTIWRETETQKMFPKKSSLLLFDKIEETRHCDVNMIFFISLKADNGCFVSMPALSGWLLASGHGLIISRFFTLAARAVNCNSTGEAHSVVECAERAESGFAPI